MNCQSRHRCLEDKMDQGTVHFAPVLSDTPMKAAKQELDHGCLFVVKGHEMTSSWERFLAERMELYL